LLEVLDNGPGVPEDERGRVFDPYYTTKAEGTGLGLAIVKKIVLEHGGEITCGESPAGGACFTIALPCQKRLRAVTGR
jgi:two-component system nitrogen regulation sensor histidine kinase NtrY